MNSAAQNISNTTTTVQRTSNLTEQHTFCSVPPVLVPVLGFGLPTPTHQAKFSYFCRSLYHIFAIQNSRVFDSIGTTKVFFVSCVLARVETFGNLTHVGIYVGTNIVEK